MDQKTPTVADIFRRAQAIRLEHPDWSYKQIKPALVKEFSGGSFTPLYNLTIPEQALRKRTGQPASHLCVEEYSFRIGKRLLLASF
jgi:hypothetical protein